MRRLSSRTRSNTAASAAGDVQVVVERRSERRPAAVERAGERRVVRRGPRGTPRGPRRARRAGRRAAAAAASDASRSSRAAAVVDRDQRVAQRARRDAGVEQLADAGDVAGRLRHLRAAHLEVGAVQPRPRRTAARSPPRSGRSRPRGAGRSGRPRRCGCRTIGRGAAMLIAEHSMCQPGPARRRSAVVPRRLARLRALPQGEVADVVLAVLVGLDPLADPELLGIEPRQAAVGRPRRDPEEDRAVVGPIGVAAARAASR